MQHKDVTNSHFVTDKVTVKLNALGPLMLYRVAGKIGGRDVVSVDNRRPLERIMKLEKKIP